ncbi:hypothetical protein ACWCP8_31840 [Streptomyces sp. NPDC002206]
MDPHPSEGDRHGFTPRSARNTSRAEQPTGRGYLYRPVADPEGAPIAVIRRIRDEIDTHITDLLDSLPSA